MSAPNNELPITFVLSAVKTCNEKKQIGSITDVIYFSTGCPWKQIYRKLEQLAQRGYLDYGVSPAYPWLTDKGRRWLEEHT